MGVTVLHGGPDCSEPVELRTLPIGSSEVVDEHLIVRGPDGDLDFTKRAGTLDWYCRSIPDSKDQECIEIYKSSRGYYEYTHRVGHFEGTNSFRACDWVYGFSTGGFADSAPDQVADEPALSPDPAEPSHTFTVDDCTCAGVDIPLQGDSSSASNDIYSSVITSSGVDYEVNGRLTCDWQATHTSENLTGTIRSYLQVSRLADQQQAQALLADRSQDVAEQQPWCEQDPEACTVAAAEYTDDRAYLVRKNIYVGRDEIVKPSTHHANLTRLLPGSNGWLVAELGITHPELEPADTWVMDTAAAIESCVAQLAD